MTDTPVPRKQRVSNRLMVVLQPLSLGPGILLLSFLLLHEVMVGSKHTVGLRLQDVVFGLLPQYVTMTGPLFMAFLMLSTGETTLLHECGYMVRQKADRLGHNRAAAGCGSQPVSP
jgi:hypothetical protein